MVHLSVALARSTRIAALIITGARGDRCRRTFSGLLVDLGHESLVDGLAVHANPARSQCGINLAQRVVH